MFLCAAFSVAITGGHCLGALVYESWHFFENVSIIDFLTDTQWTVLFENPRYGIMPLVTGTLVTSVIALLVALPLGTIIAIYLSEYANTTVREILKPILGVTERRADSGFRLLRAAVRHAHACKMCYPTCLGLTC